MKTTLSIFLLVLTSCLLQAQEGEFNAKTKGSYFANGSASIFSTTNKVGDDSSNSFSIDFVPRAGYFIMDNLAIGLGLVISSNNETTDDLFGEQEVTTTGFGITPLARYYFENNLFAEAAVGIGFTNTKFGGDTIPGLDGDMKSNSFGFRIGAGYALFLGDHIAVEPSINYSWEDINPEDAPSDFKQSLSSIFLNIGITAFF
ncbi:MAG: outer membrane beta-barrel protein [Psychroserpens sp.]|uniref:autotransporter outer membrane beta-barrel domain-containing protein n=1 Tax=Psychroserpens sp. TaxID=2020870 RepID=UPI003CBA413B